MSSIMGDKELIEYFYERLIRASKIPASWMGPKNRIRMNKIRKIYGHKA